MPQERESQFPVITAAEVDAMPGDPATKAARNIMVRRISGIPRRAYLTGANDHAPVVQGVRDLVERTQAFMDAVTEGTKMTEPMRSAYADLVNTLNDHGAPEVSPVVKSAES